MNIHNDDRVVCCVVPRAVTIAENHGFTVSIENDGLHLTRPTRPGQFETRKRIVPYADSIGSLIRYGDLSDAVN